MKTKLIVMAFDGETKTEGEFDSIESAWNRANDMGSRWFFYPFCFVTTKSGKTIKDAPDPLRHLIGQRVKYVAKCFEAFAKTPESKDMDCEQFMFAVPV